MTRLRLGGFPCILRSDRKMERRWETWSAGLAKLPCRFFELWSREPQRYSRLSSHLYPPSIQWHPAAQVIEMFPISPSSPHVVEAMPFDASHAAKRREEKTGTLSIIQRTREARHTSHFEKKLSNFGSTPMSLWPSPQSIVGRT